MVISLAFAFIPLPFMIVVGGVLALILMLYGELILVVSAPFALGYIVKTYKKINGMTLSIVSGILQSFFVLDVVSVIILCFKEKRWVKLTISIIILLVILCITAIFFIATLFIKYGN